MTQSILVVDSQPTTCTLIARTLQPRGYTVATACDGEAAHTAAAARSPDLIITDVVLPGSNGLALVDALRQQNPHLPVIAISSVHDVLDKPEVVPVGLDPKSISFLAKPFGLVPLVALVNQLLPQTSNQAR